MSPSVENVPCLIYTRKSSDEGLATQQFNSLDAQRESGEAYIKAQASRGWYALPERFDDGGFSGGNMDRPGLKRLIERIKAGKIKVVVVYKLDRLSRNIRDFATLTDLFDEYGVALVSVTQSFDSSTAMGKLMLHILVSFASFERELASERTRDKIALQRQRGQWSGGRPLLGYDATPKGLVVNQAEAAIVRRLFAMYLEVKSLNTVVARLNAEGVRTKSWTSKAGKTQGGFAWGKNVLSQLLSSIIYTGRVPHKGTSYPGQHAAIIDGGIFQRVQELLAENRRCGPSAVRNRHQGLLKGLVVCAACGKAMVHTCTTKGSVTHRYYACNSRTGASAAKCKGGTLPAGQIEDFVLEKVKHRFAAPEMVTRVLDLVRAQNDERRRDLDAQRMLLAAEIESSEAVLKGGASADAADRHEQASRTLSDVDQQLADLDARRVDRSTVEHGLREFTPIWVSLSPTERAALLAQVVGEVRWDAIKGEIAIDIKDETTSAEEAA